MSSTGGHCYCGTPDIESTAHFTCDKCKRKFHEGCLLSGSPSVLQGDYLFNFKCQACGGGEEEFTRMRLQWTQVVQLTLYNLQLSGTGMCGYFRWKEHICAFIDQHWATFFASHRKKTSLWHGTVAGVLSSGCPATFVSGAQQLKETGWWKLAVTQPPTHGTPSPKPPSRKKESPASTTMVESPKEGLRSRRGKTSIQAAMELKAKRSTLMEAKEIRKTKLARIDPTPPAPKTSVPSLLSEHLKSPIITSPGSLIPVSVSSPALVFTGLLPSTSDDSSSKGDYSQGVVPGSLLAEQLISGTSSFHPISSRTGSIADLSDESSNVSQSSYLTEKDIKLQPTLPNLLMSEDVSMQDQDDSDLEIDPGTLSPPPPGSPIRLQQSPTVQELLSTMDSESSDHPFAGVEDSCHDYSNQGSSVSLDTSYQGSVSMDTSYSVGNSSSAVNTFNQGFFSVFGSVKADNEVESHGGSVQEEETSVVDSESESAASDTDEDDNTETKQRTGRPRKPEHDKENEVETVPDVTYQLLSSYEERLLLTRLEQASRQGALPPHANRLKRKLLVRQLKREHNLPQFDIDAELNKLSQRSWAAQYGSKMRQPNIPGNLYSGGRRVLDKFQTITYNLTRSQLQKQPSFLNRLVGTEDDQLESICSPYTARTLKPFIRRDYESQPVKMKLLQEIKAYLHRNNPDWKPDCPPPLDYCYVRPQHIASVNALCREFFWPGIDVSECLQYPDFSCVALFRKIVIGFAFMVPDVKQNEAYISFIFTHPEWRHAGMATFMLYHLIQTCMGKDVTLHVSATNNAMLLYQKFGFKPEEFILDFYDKYFPANTHECKHAFFLRLQR